jgi:hypothetical protein
MPAVDQPFVEVDGREVDKDVIFHFSTTAWFTAATLPLLLSLHNNNKLYKKRGIINDNLQYIQ